MPDTVSYATCAFIAFACSGILGGFSKGVDGYRQLIMVFVSGIAFGWGCWLLFKSLGI